MGYQPSSTIMGSLHLHPINCPVKDDVAMSVLRLESRMDSAVDYLARLKVAMSWIDAELWPQMELPKDLDNPQE